jgi:hypothetical protein
VGREDVELRTVEWRISSYIFLVIDRDNRESSKAEVNI